MRIAIVDDLAADRAELRLCLETELAARRLDAEVVEFASGEDFFAAFEPGRFAVAFLDIYMDGITGMEVAQRLYASDRGCRIVFLTSSMEHILESYSVRATHYLIKPFSHDGLAQALDFCFASYEPSDVLLVRTKEGNIPVRRRDILYIESVSRHGCVRLADRTLESSDGFAAIAAKLEGDRRFLICGRGLMLQMEHVTVQRDDEFVMDDGSRLPISRRMRADVLEAFRRFTFDSMRRERK